MGSIYQTLGQNTISQNNHQTKSNQTLRVSFVTIYENNYKK